ncbi:molybdopterin molybdotransferase MoeA [Chitinasiproducens palmae]|nr:gephyrin-like molybdotransferase Glp [Chitinasiproducens palmae]
MPDPSRALSGNSDLSPDAAHRLIATRLAVLCDARGAALSTERLPLAQALDRVLADDVVAPIDVPAHDNSAMDGYAFAHAGLPDGEPVSLPVVGRALAGRPHDGDVGRGMAVRIMTGAAMPEGTDTVVPIEAATCSPARVQFARAAVRPGANRRHAGEDWARGDIALPAGTVLRPPALGVLASLGIASVAVRRRLRVAVFSTGDELREPGDALPAGAIYDSNRFNLLAMLRRLGVEPLDLGIVPDDPAALRQVLVDAARLADAVITSGGVSAGDADHVRAAVAASGEVEYWKLALRPGRPFAFGTLRVPADATAQPRQSVPFFGLPGNPAAVVATFYLLVRDALLRLAQARAEPVPRVPATTTAALPKRAGRAEVIRARAQRDGGGWTVAPVGSPSSGALNAMVQANCLVLLEAERAAVNAGDTVDVTFFDGLL